MIPITLGSDPEYPVATLDGTIVSSTNVIPEYSKDEPYILDTDMAVYKDNVMVEVRSPVSHSSEEFVKMFRKVFVRLHEFLGSRGGGFKPIVRASYEYPSEELASPEALTFGCSPEKCAYANRKKSPPDPYQNLRSSGGHIHVGRTDYKKASHKALLMTAPSKIDMIKLMDIYVGLPLTFLDKDPSGPARKQLYGKAGRFRRTNYGVEYRTPSNFWTHDPDLVNFVWESVEQAVGFLETEPDMDQFDWKTIRSVIDSGNNLQALSLLKAMKMNTKTIEKLRHIPYTPEKSKWL